MKEFYRFSQLGILCLYLLFYSPFRAHSQVQTARNISTGPNSGGFYEYLPAGYSSTGSQTWPLLVYCHGTGELGNGTTQLSLVLDAGPPMLINTGKFPTSFTVNGNSYSFIVISPQFMNWPAATDIDDVIQYAIQHYKVDRNRIYLTGMSMGGAATWGYPGTSSTYASNVAAILPICGAIGINDQFAYNIATSNIGVFATHNIDDPEVAYTFTIANVNAVNGNVPPPAIPAQDTIFPAGNGGHDAWDNTYDPTHLIYKKQLNVYQWMLQFSRSSLSAPLPVKLSAYTAALAPDGTEVNVDWTTAVEQNNNYFIVQRSATGESFQDLDTVAAAAPPDGGHSYVYTDPAPLSGNDFYRLEQVDKDGKATYYGVLKVSVNSSDRAGLQVSPNPTVSQAYLHLVHPETGTVQVSLNDMQGRVLRVWTFQKQATVWDQPVDLSGLASGSYVLVVKGTTIREVKTIIKE
jgi:hypothetical protein